MAMADQRNVIVNVEKGAASVVVKVLHPAADNFQRLLIGNAEIFSEEFTAGRKSFCGVRLLPGETPGGNAEQQIGIGRERSPHGALRRRSHTGKSERWSSRSTIIWKWR